MLQPEEADGEGEGHEGVKPKTKKNPMLPSQSEVDDHYAANHVPFRSWCEACVKGKSVNDPHSSIRRKEDQAVSTVSIDYGYMTSESGGGDEGMYMPILVSIDRNTGKINANVAQ